jgi:uncharacterized membrane protein YdjX (TVP38/TMEM64 family)
MRLGAGVEHVVLGLLAWAKAAGLGGALLFAGAYVLGTLLFFPGSVLTLAAGFLYGLVGGMAVVVPGSILGALLAFLLGRTVLRRPTERLLRRHPRFAAVDTAVAENGFRVVLLLRLSPLFPFNLLNYGLGVTRVPLLPYLLGSALGMLPGTLLYVYLGSLLTSASELLGGKRPDAGWAGRALFLGGLVATAAVVVLVGRAARRALEAVLGAPAPPAGPSS